MAARFWVGTSAFFFALAIAGCLSIGPQSCSAPPHNAVHHEVESNGRAILEAAVKAEGRVVELCGWDGSGSSHWSGISNTGGCERTFKYDFRCTSGESEFATAGKKGYLLPAKDYPRVIATTQREFSNLVTRVGGTITHTKTSGSTFELDYRIGKAVGRFRGRLGPVPEAAANEQNVTSLQVDFSEEYTR